MGRVNTPLIGVSGRSLFKPDPLRFYHQKCLRQEFLFFFYSFIFYGRWPFPIQADTNRRSNKNVPLLFLGVNNILPLHILTAKSKRKMNKQKGELEIQEDQISTRYVDGPKIYKKRCIHQSQASCQHPMICSTTTSKSLAFPGVE